MTPNLSGEKGGSRRKSAKDDIRTSTRGQDEENIPMPSFRSAAKHLDRCYPLERTAIYYVKGGLHPTSNI